MRVQLDLIGIATKDMGRSLAFYRLLGFPIPEEADQERHVEVGLKGIRLAWDHVDLLKEMYGSWDKPVGHRVELALSCDSPEEVDAVYQMVTEAGYNGYKEPWDAFWGQRYAVIEDPDGNLLSLFADK